ncbi:MAG TPA: host attachment protein [Beijerinckiaceae bacterium]|nr:host attachment protein [Beijerinckiaceae bacterium]
MKKGLTIAHNGWVVVGDGRTALLLSNQGDEVYPNLQVQQVLEAPPNPPTHEQGTDQPPRAVFGGRRSAIAQTDWHELAEQRFAGDVAEALEKVHRTTPIKALIVVAPPRTLSNFRQAFSDNLKRSIVAEVDKDLTKHPLSEIERLLTRRDNRGKGANGR